MATLALLDSLRGLQWPATTRVRFGAPGIHPSRVRGPAPEFSEYRAFRQGDDPRRLDWKLLARTDRAYLRVTEDRATLGTLIILDASASMDFPGDGSSKWSFAKSIATGLAQVAHQSGDPVGVSVPGGIPAVELAPRTRRGIVGEIATALDGVQPGREAPLLEHLARRPVPARLVLLSDFLDEDPGALRAVAVAAEIHAVRIVAAGELDPPDHYFTAVDPERAETARAFGPEVWRGYSERFNAWAERTAARWRAAGARWHEAVTSEPVVQVVRRIIGRGA